MKRFEHVIVAGIDGAGAFIQNAKTPCMDAIFASGARTFRAFASRPSISAECWGSMLTGVSPALHGLTNEWISQHAYPTDSRFPTLYKRVRGAYPDAAVAAYCDWSPLVTGIVEADAGVDCLSLRDAELIGPACEYIRSRKPAFMFVHMDSVDGAGHKFGYGTPQHLNQIEVCDRYVQLLYSACRDAGMLDSTLFLVLSDHGGTCDKRPEGGYSGSHGGWTEAERRISFLAAGPGIQAGEIGDMNIRDTAAIVLYALGIDMPAFDPNGWTAQLPENLFAGVQVPYIDISGETGAVPRVSRVRHTSQTAE
ncbi:MAG: alkaline phosphatase [Clostridia bacterium]|nr:alkaline phosphatase [Clostridia bacterium]